MLIFPIYLVYELGVLLIPEVYNGADLLTAELLSLLHGDRVTYILINLGLGLGLLLFTLLLRRRGHFEPRRFVSILLESLFYAVTMGSFILFVMQRLLHIDPQLAVAAAAHRMPRDVNVIARVILSCGAGVHEELLFRLMMISALTFLGAKLLKLRPFVGVIVAFVFSSLLFSAAHHVIGGEPWHVGVFTYRFLCGLFFASIFYWRGLAVAVYSHAIYDIFVLVLS